MGHQKNAYLRRPPPGYNVVRDGNTVIAHEHVSSRNTVGFSVLAIGLFFATAALYIHLNLPADASTKLFPFTPVVLGVCGGVFALLSAFLFSTNSERIGFDSLSLQTTTTYTVLPWWNSNEEYPFARLVEHESTPNEDECTFGGTHSCLKFQRCGDVGLDIIFGFEPIEKTGKDDVAEVTVGQVKTRSIQWSKPLALSENASTITHGTEGSEEEVSVVELVAFWRGYTNFLRELVQLPALTQHMDPDEDTSVSLPSSVDKSQALRLRRALEAAFGITSLGEHESAKDLTANVAKGRSILQGDLGVVEDDLPPKEDGEERIDVERDDSSETTTCSPVSEVRFVSKISNIRTAIACIVGAVFFRVALDDGGFPVTSVMLVTLGVVLILSDRTDFSTFDLSRLITLQPSDAPQAQEDNEGEDEEDEEGAVCGYSDWSCAARFRRSLPATKTHIDWSNVLIERSGISDFHGLPFDSTDTALDFDAGDKCQDWTSRLVDPDDAAPLPTTRLRVVVLPAGAHVVARVSTPSTVCEVSLGVRVTRPSIPTEAATTDVVQCMAQSDVNKTQSQISPSSKAVPHSSIAGGSASTTDGVVRTESTVVPIAWGICPSEAARTARRFERMFTGLSLLSSEHNN